MLGRLFRLCIVLVLAPAIYAFAYEAGLFLTANAQLYPTNWATYGFMLYVIAYPFISGDRIRFIEVFEHELGHAVSALLLLGRVERLEATASEGGVVTSTGPRSAISLAPYCLPIFTIPLLVVKPFMFSSAREVIDFWIGFSVAFHYVGLVRDLSVRQTDIWRTGLLFSLGIIFIVNTIFLVVILCVAFNKYAEIWNYFRNAYARTPEAYRIALQMARRGLEFIP